MFKILTAVMALLLSLTFPPLFLVTGPAVFLYVVGLKDRARLAKGYVKAYEDDRLLQSRRRAISWMK